MFIDPKKPIIGITKTRLKTLNYTNTSQWTIRGREEALE